jgi:hypothetical protein
MSGPYRERRLAFWGPRRQDQVGDGDRVFSLV